MGFEMDFFVAQFPHVNVMYSRNAGNLFELLRNLVQVNFGWHHLHQDLHRLFQNGEGVHKQVNADEHRYERVDPVPFEKVDKAGAGNHRQRSERIAQQMEVSRPDVQVLLLVAVKDEHRDPVGNQPQQSEPEHPVRVDGAQVDKTRNSLENQENRNTDQHQRIDKRSQDFGPAVAKSGAPRAWFERKQMGDVG